MEEKKQMVIFNLLRLIIISDQVLEIVNGGILSYIHQAGKQI